MTEFAKLFNAILEDDVSLLFSCLIAFVFVCALLSHRPKQNRVLGDLQRSAAGLMTMLGVLGTFTGIFVGLWDFDVEQIDASVPKLLNGLKIAFSTSIVGMGAAISFKLYQAFKFRQVEEHREATPEAMLAALREIEEGIGRSSEAHEKSLEEIRRAISSEQDSSLVTQVQKLRTSIQDGQDSLIREFREFAQTMTESNSEALIQALEKVIRDFNTKLSDQFGENFKHLNDAVGKLLVWQENYREHIELLENRIEAAIASLEASEESVKSISVHAQRMPDLLEGMQATIDNLEGHLEAVASLKDQALGAFPVIERNLENLTAEFQRATNNTVRRMTESMDRQSVSLDKLHDGYSELHGNMKEAQDKFQEHLKGVLVQTEESIKSQFQAFNDEMHKELERELSLAMNTMAQKLASLSEKFAEDYTPLTERLREVLRIGRG